MNTSIKNLMISLDRALTPHHATEIVAARLTEAGYERLTEGAAFSLRRGGRYFLLRDGGALIAFAVGQKTGGFRIVASHLDSPCLKVKGDPVTCVGGCQRLNVEVYGGPLLYSFLDIPLCLAGRVVCYDSAARRIEARTFCDPHKLVIPSRAIHMNREANKALSLNPQTDLQPIVSLSPDFSFEKLLGEQGEVLSYDLFLVPASQAYLAGFSEEFLVSPRIDDLVSVFASVEALAAAGDAGISLVYLAGNEEIGSGTRQGAGSDFLSSTLRRVAAALGEDADPLFDRSYLISCDNAHAVHPNHPENSDPTNEVRLGDGVVIKHHANGNYTTDAFTEGVFRALMKEADIPCCDFYMRADMPCGSTLGAISQGQVGIRSIDIGLPQLSMHSACETMCAADYPVLVSALSAFFASDLRFDGENTATI